MSEHFPTGRHGAGWHGRPDPALSFGRVVDAYDRARPTYPDEAAAWLAGREPARVLELGAGTGKLTQGLLALGHDVVATDPLEPMLRRLAGRMPQAHPTLAVAEVIPLRSRSVDVVVSGQAFHWFDLDRALPEIARVLRPAGQIALAWNVRDERIPWVRRLGRLIGTPEQADDPTNALVGSRLFGYVESATFRFWNRMDRDLLRDLVTSRSSIAVMPESQREQVLRKVDDLYAEYGRGADGMQLPYVTRCFRAVVRPQPEDEPEPERERNSAPAGPDDGTDTDALLIDFS
ncbi:MAG: class I SAM-dependent methyltransferase [Nocardioidaceae bacterium]